MTNTIYEDIKARTPEKIHLNIKAVLVYHVGAENALSKEELSIKLFGVHTDTTDRQIRDAIAEMVTEYDELIVTNTRRGGYYYAGTPEEIDENIADLQDRINQLSRRIESLRRARNKVFHKNYQASVTAQGRLF
jgi:DNA replication protein DnaD